MKVLTGVDQPDLGRIILDGKEIQAKSPQHAQSLGISTVYQEINLCTNLSCCRKHPAWTRTPQNGPD